MVIYLLQFVTKPVTYRNRQILLHICLLQYMYQNLLHSVTKSVIKRNNLNIIPHMIKKEEEGEELL